MTVQVTDARSAALRGARRGRTGRLHRIPPPGRGDHVRPDLFEPAAAESEAEEALARFCLDSARKAGDQVEPADPFLAGWIERHPEYADLVHAKAAHLGEED